MAPNPARKSTGAPFMPERLEFKGLARRLPPDTVLVDHTSKFGNPFVPGKPAPKTGAP